MMRKMFTESPAQFWQRVTNGGAHNPLRTFKELCAELGVAEATMRAKMRLEGAPKPVIDNRTHSKRARVCWYDPKEFKRWFKSLQEQN